MECNNAIMDLESIEKLIEMRENKLYLQQHTGKVWQGKNEFWYTYYLPDNSEAIIFTIRWLNRDSEWLMAKNGKRILACIFDHTIKNACKGAGIPERSMHKIRRTYGTTLIDNNVEDSLIMSQMGHTNIQTTHKYYYFANKEEKHKRNQINGSITF